MPRDSLEREAHTTKPGQAVLVGGMKDGENVHYAHIVGVEEKDGFKPLYINDDPPRQSMMQALKQGHDFYENHAEVTKRASVGRPIYNINWDTDDGVLTNDGEGNELPSTVMVPSDLEEDEIADYLFDKYGWLVLGFVKDGKYLAVDDELPYSAVTKRASTGMIVRDGDPSSPPSDIFMAEDPTQADASNMGGPTAPSNAGVPADVGGDDLVPYDSPSAPPADVFMNAEYKTYESRPVRNALFGVAFAVSGLYFWSTAGSVVKNWVVVRVEKYAPKLLEPQFQTMLTLTAFFGIIYFGMKLRGSSKGLTIPSMIDLSEASVDA